MTRYAVGADQRLEDTFLATLANGPAADVHETRIPLDSFCTAARQTLYQAILEVASQHEHVTDFLVRRHLEETKQFRAAGGESELRGVFASERTHSPRAAAKTLRELATQRAIHAGALGIASAASEGHVAEARAELRRLLDAIEGEAAGEALADELDMRELVSEALADLQTPRPATRVRVDILGEAISHATPGALITIGGQTGAGKSSLALYLADAYSRAGITPGIISIEDPRKTWADRGAAMVSGVSLMGIRRAHREPTYNELDAVASAIPRAMSHRLRLACMYRPEHLDVLAQMRREVARGCQVLFVDYLQEIKNSAHRGERRHEMLADIARDMKTEARRLGVPLFLLSQLRRLDPKARTKEPSAHDLKETGDLENMSEGVVLLWRESDEEHAPTFGKIAKLKSSPLRPRFVVSRDAVSGRVEGLERRIDPKPEEKKSRAASNVADFFRGGSREYRDD